MSEESPKEKVDWIRGSKKIDRRNVSLEKVEEAHKRGVSIEADGDNPSQSIVIKKVVEGKPAPKTPEKV